MSIYQDRGGVLWVGTENAGLNALNPRQEQFVNYVHHPSEPNSLSPGRVKAIYQDSNGVLWAIYFEHRDSSGRRKHEGEPSFALCDRPSRIRDNSQRQAPDGS